MTFVEQGADWSDAGASRVPRKCTVKTRPLPCVEVGGGVWKRDYCSSGHKFQDKSIAEIY